MHKPYIPPKIKIYPIEVEAFISTSNGEEYTDKEGITLNAPPDTAPLPFNHISEDIQDYE